MRILHSKASNGWSSAELVCNRCIHNTGFGICSYKYNWVDAMDDFQDHGVIVFSNSNTSANDNAEITAALPEIFPELAEAFIAAVNIDVGGHTPSWVLLDQRAIVDGQLPVVTQQNIA